MEKRGNAMSDYNLNKNADLSKKEPDKYSGMRELHLGLSPNVLLCALGGGILGALLFYLITNTASWLFNPFGNPEYTRNFIGWLRALTLGTHGWPETWQFFRNTLLSGGLFTGLFVGAMKMVEAAESAREKEPAEESESEPEPEPKATDEAGT